MSHNKIKVNSQSPNVSSDISLSLNNIETNVTNTDDRVLMYQSNQWISGVLAGNTKTLYYHKYYKDLNTGYTNYNYSNNDFFVWRTGTGSVYADEFIHSSVTRNAATNANSPFTSNGTWRESLTLTDSGTYLFLFRLCFGSSFASNDSCDVQLSDGTAFSAKMHMNSEGKFGDILWGIKTISSSTTFKTIVNNISGTVDVLERAKRNHLSLAIYKFN